MGRSKTVESQFAYPRARVFDAMVRSIPTIRGMRVAEADPAAGRIVVKSTISLASWGETINVDLAETTPGNTTAKMRSGMKFQLVDWGKNKRNLDAITNATNQALQQTPVV